MPSGAEVVPMPLEWAERLRSQADMILVHRDETPKTAGYGIIRPAGVTDAYVKATATITHVGESVEFFRPGMKVLLSRFQGPVALFGDRGELVLEQIHPSRIQAWVEGDEDLDAQAAERHPLSLMPIKKQIAARQALEKVQEGDGRRPL